MKSAALVLAFAPEATIGCDSDPRSCPGAKVRANAGRSLPAPVAIRVANPSRTKSLRLMRLSSVNFPFFRRIAGSVSLGTEHERDIIQYFVARFRYELHVDSSFGGRSPGILCRCGCRGVSCQSRKRNTRRYGL